jgi:hypothetical protein
MLKEHGENAPEQPLPPVKTKTTDGGELATPDIVTVTVPLFAVAVSPGATPLRELAREAAMLGAVDPSW